MRSLLAGLALTCCAVVATPAHAQINPIELGIDAALAIGLDDPRVTTIGIPIQQFRVGFFTSPTVSFEPTLGITYIDVENIGDFSRIAVGLGILFHFSPDRFRSQTYFRPFGGFTTVSNGASESDANLGIGLGIKTPFANRRLATRLEAFLNHTFDEPDDSNAIGVLFGLSFFTR